MRAVFLCSVLQYKGLPIGIQTFRDIIENGFLYVDKTEVIRSLIESEKGVYFLSRPRRFGKSLLISTLEEIFSGNKELFKDLWIYHSDYSWEKHPVIRLNYIMDRIGRNRPSSAAVFELIRALNENDIEKCMEILREVFISVDYDIQIPKEKYWQTVFYLIFKLLGFRITTEVKTNPGRVDAVIDDKCIYIFEFKLNGTKEEALAQIKTKKYYEKYIGKGKPIYLIGAEFKDRNIGDYTVETLTV